MHIRSALDALSSFHSTICPAIKVKLRETTVQSIVSKEEHQRALIVTEANTDIGAYWFLCEMVHLCTKIGGDGWSVLARNTVTRLQQQGRHLSHCSSASRIRKRTIAVNRRTHSEVQTGSAMVTLRRLPTTAHLPNMNIQQVTTGASLVRRGATIRFISVVSTVVRYLSLECASFLEMAATWQFDLHGWLLLPVGFPPFFRNTSLDTIVKDEEEHRRMIEQSTSAVQRLTKAIDYANDSLSWHVSCIHTCQPLNQHWYNHSVTCVYDPSHLNLYEQYSILRTLFWAKDCTIRVQILLLLALNTDLSAMERRMWCRGWYLLLSEWCSFSV